MIPYFLPNVNTNLPHVLQTVDMVCALYLYITFCIFAQSPAIPARQFFLITITRMPSNKKVPIFLSIFLAKPKNIFLFIPFISTASFYIYFT